MKLHVYLHVSDAHSSVRTEKKKKGQNAASLAPVKAAFVKRFYASCFEVPLAFHGRCTILRVRC